MRSLDLTNIDHDFIDRVRTRTGQNPARCIQCGKCTAGCPANFAYDLPVSQVMRMLQEGQREILLTSGSIWMCVQCQTCSVRCPMEIDVADVMETLRSMAWDEGKVTHKRVRAFHRSFLKSVEKHGRMHELGIMAGYAARTGRVVTDVDLLPRILPLGKLHVKAGNIEAKDEVARILERYRKKAGF
jgi:heterodisulfide reductase subunit C